MVDMMVVPRTVLTFEEFHTKGDRPVAGEVRHTVMEVVESFRMESDFRADRVDSAVEEKKWMDTGCLMALHKDVAEIVTFEADTVLAVLHQYMERYALLMNTHSLLVVDVAYDVAMSLDCRPIHLENL